MAVATRSNPHLVVKSNELINARMNGFTVAQVRLFEMLIAQLDKDLDEFQTQRVYLADFISETGTKHKGEFERAREVTKSLMGQVIEIWDGDKLKQRNILYRADYDKKKPYVEIVFHPDLRPYLLQLKERFTSYDVRNILALKKIHSIRLYQLLKQYLFTGTCTFEVDRLKYILGVENKYKKYNDFKKYAVFAAQKELKEKCDISFEFEEIKKGKKVELLKFTITRQKSKYSVGARKENEVEIKAEPEVLDTLCKLGISEERSRYYINTLEEKDIHAAIEYTRKQFEAGRIKSSATAYLIKLLDSGFKESPRSEFAVPPKERTKRKRTERQEEVRLIEQLEAEFGAYRKQQVDKLCENAKEEDWILFQAWAQQQLFINNKIFENGRFLREHPDTENYFRIFISDRLPERSQAFIDWAAVRGYRIGMESGSFWLIRD